MSNKNSKKNKKTHLGNIIKANNDKYVNKIILERTKSLIFHEHCANAYTFIDEEDEKQMDQIEIEQKLNIMNNNNNNKTPYITPEKQVKKYKVDSLLLEETDQKHDDTIITTPRTVEIHQKKKPLNKAFQIMEEYKRPQAANRKHQLYERHLEWTKEQATNQWLTERRLEDKRELYLIKLKLDDNVHKQTEEIAYKLNRNAERKRKAFLAEEEFKLKAKLEKEHFEMMKEMKKEAFKKARKFFCGATLKQNFKSWANYVAFMKVFRAERAKKRKRRCKKAIACFILFTGLLFLGWFLYTEIRRMQAAQAEKSERRRRRILQQRGRKRLLLRG